MTQSTATSDLLLTLADTAMLPSRQPSALLDDDARRVFLMRHLTPRPFRVRAAHPDDLPALQALEARCWAEPMRVSAAALAARLARYPQGQLVLVIDGVVRGVIYSQRIARVDALDGCALDDVHRLHDANGAVAQLLAINIDPDVQQHNLGDQLLEFMLIYCSVLPGVTAVVAVTRCKQFRRRTDLTLDAYLSLRHEHGGLADPILRFHELHGARIVQAMPGYRPGDADNDGHGVLVHYDLHARRRAELDLDAEPPAQAAPRRTREVILCDIALAVREGLGASRQDDYAAERPWMEMGLDSADLLALNERLAGQFRCALEPTLFFQYNTAQKLAAHLEARLAASPVAAGAGRRAEDIAIVGIGCRLPGGIDTPEAFWAALRDGRSSAGALPAGRWIWPDDIAPEQAHRGIDRGGFLDEVAAFDAPFFRISPAEAESMDPRQRMLLELAWHTFEQAGHAPGAAAGSRTGVFIGASGADYARLLERADGGVEAHYSTGSALSLLANRLSYFYDLNGPSLVIDTACSSSLVAVQKALQSIRDGESEQALVGGINLILHPAESIAYYRAGMLAKDGRCKSFDARADGYVRGEGAAMLLLKPLSRARADGDHVHAVIRGAACNHGGLAGGLTVPNPEQQARLLRSAWEAAGVRPDQLGYIEAHGTGTALGDPIEIHGLRLAFAGAAESDARVHCGIGSVKTNLGHLEAAAGIVGLLKTVLCLTHRQLPPLVHFERLNPRIDLGDGGLHVVDALREWSAPAGGGPRLAGVSSFGSGGANAHVVVAEYVASDTAVTDATPAGPVAFVLSAKDDARLAVLARAWLTWLDGDGRAVSLVDLARLSQLGRDAMPARVACVVTTRDELVQRLGAFLDGAGRTDPVAPTPRDAAALLDAQAVAACAARGALDELAARWQAGADVDWAALHRDAGAPRRIAAPTYPFAHDRRYWARGEDASRAAVAGAPSPEPTGSAADAAAERSAEIAPALFAPLWRVAGPTPAASGSGAGRVLVVGAKASQQTALTSHYAHAHWLPLDAADTIDALQAHLAACGRLDEVVWIAPDAAAANPVAAQQAGVLPLFRLVKALLAQGYGERAFALTAVTRRSQAVFDADPPEPDHAGVHGLTGVIANEWPRWTVRSLDLDEGLDAADAPWRALPAHRAGEVLAWRDGQWFERVLSPVRRQAEGSPAYRQGGVYVVIGGAGGVGEAWTRHVASRYAAQVVWIGRRAPDEALRARLDALAALGLRPIYLQADAADPAALRAAWDTLSQRFPAVHGIVHSATGEFDLGLAQLDEARFRAILTAKVDISVNLAAVTSDASLDFLLFFSSVTALEKNGGFSGYVAGGAFEDAFALHLAHRLPCMVRVVNWGHWDVGTGATISTAARTRLRQSGGVTLQPDEAMAALDAALVGPLTQVAVLKHRYPERLPYVDLGRCVDLYDDAPPVDEARASPPPGAADARARITSLEALSLFNHREIDACLLPLLSGVLASLGRLDPASGSPPPSGYLARWLAASRRILARHGYRDDASLTLEDRWRAWAAARDTRFPQADLRAAVALAERCLRALPAVLTGASRATDVLFPGGSMVSVEGVYRDNAVADYFNDLLGDALIAAIEARLRRDPAARLRILEIGAGTGGTTARLLPRLDAYRERIAEYAYTDVSKAFLTHADAHFGAAHPYLSPKLFDVERALQGQAVRAGDYDIAIATNVLHATRDISRALANAKAALRRHGVLMLNEIACASVFAHVTFGLLEGWWLTEDAPLRIPDAPGLTPDGWHTVLRRQGFQAIAFPAPDAHRLGQQIVIATSDGVVHQAVTQDDRAARANASAASATASGSVPTPSSALADAAERLVRRLVARTLRMDGAELDSGEPLDTYGIDSILVIQITNGLCEQFGDVPPTLLFECRTVGALAAFVARRHPERVRELAGLGDEAAPPRRTQGAERAAAPVEAAPGAADEPIAVIGMSCRLPQAADLDAYWRLLAAGAQAVGEIPAERWPVEGFYHGDVDEAVERGRSYSKWGAFIDGVMQFDPLFFNIAPREVAAIDPHERLFLQSAWETLEDAGYTRERLANEADRQVGVFAGITRTGFDLFGPPLWQAGHTAYPHTSFSSLANRVSYFLNLHGPSMPVDTMCSSSLTALHQACQSLRSGECRLAIVGGVNVYLHPSSYVGLSGARMLSKDGVCRSFGKDANGFVPGEGVASVLLKPLSQARADGDRIHAVIRATHVNHGGRTNGYTVPNPQAQAELVAAALRRARLDARAVGYIEAHGTGTALGDPIEVAALTEAFRRDTADTGFCALGSVKTNIGHLEAAAGIAGFIKVVLQMRHGQIAPSLHATEPNPDIDFARTPFVVQQTLADWPRPVLKDADGRLGERPRAAGVSSFGAGGANAHVIVEEYAEPAEPDGGDAAHGEQIVVLSARNDERLAAGARRLAEFLAHRTADGAAPALADLAYTLQTGREAMDARLAFVVRDLAQLQARLAAYAVGERDVEALYCGHARQHRDLVGVFEGDGALERLLGDWFDAREHGRLAQLWVNGIHIDWRRLRPDGRDHRTRVVSLPTYPFATDEYRLPVPAKQGSAAIPAAAIPDAVATLPATPAARPSGPTADAVTAIPAASPAARAARPTAAATPAARDASARAAIALRAPSAQAAALRRPAAPLGTLRLRAPSCAASSDSAGSAGQLLVEDDGDGVLSIRLDAAARPPFAVDSVCAALANGLRLANADADATAGAIVLHGLDRLFPDDADDAGDLSLAARVAALVAGSARPVIASLGGLHGRRATLIACGFDLLIGAGSGVWRMTHTDAARACLTARFGPAAAWRAAEPTPLDGAALREAGAGLAIVAADALAARAHDLARWIAQASPAALAALKRHFSAGLGALVAPGGDVPAELRLPEPASMARWPEAPASVEAEMTAADFDATLEPIAFDSDVVSLQRHRNGVVVMTLHDRDSKNTFSSAFVAGVLGAFERIGRLPDCKAVVLRGYDNYFACGGTRQGLDDIQRGRARFTDEQSYRMPLACEVPVIAAMQGHAIGAGWTMGLYCDWAVYSEESIYQSPYMRYGFTPGAGSTLLFRARFGHDLGAEILLSAREFPGHELKQRGIAMPVVPRERVFAHAFALASRLAEGDRATLVAQKAQRSAALRSRIDATYRAELAMHAHTFVGNPDVPARLARHFRDPDGQGEGAAPAVAEVDAGAVAPVPEAKLLSTLRQGLAEELHLRLDDIDTDAAFIDLGIDSIVAVTWVRGINRRFGLSIGATKIYSHPTLRQFARFVGAQIDARWAPAGARGGVAQPAPAPASAGAASDGDAAVLGWLKTSLAQELLIEADALDEDSPFVDLGIDSITAVTWIKAVNQRYGLSIGATKIYSHPCLTDFHRHVATLLVGRGHAAGVGDGGGATAQPTRAVAPATGEPRRLAAFALRAAASAGRNEAARLAHPPASAAPDPAASRPPGARGEPAAAPYRSDAPGPIAIVGMAGQFPQAADTRQFWRNLEQARDCLSEIPPSRWSIDAYYDADRRAPGKTVCRRMGALDDVDCFDPLFFNISPSEAEYMDPQQRLFLENSWRCIEDAGYDPTTLAGARCGVFVGCAASDYGALIGERSDSAYSLLGESIAILPARIAYHLNLQGPCMAIDTACSSSLVALASACDNLALDHCDSALAGGVYVINGPDIHVQMSQAGMLSPDGRCYSFDQRGNGFAPGEGVGVLLLKRLADAQRDGDDIYAVVRGWGVNQDGKTNGITAPNGDAQARLETGVYRRFGIDPAGIQLVEAHGTATRLGDPIEFDALCQSFRASTDARRFCALGSVKSNIGHLAPAAGVAGVIKTALALRRRVLPPTIHYETLNEHIALDDSPFYVNTECRAWDAPGNGLPRRAAVSSFGFSGTNAHVVLEAAPEPPVAPREGALRGAFALPLSARSPAQLGRYAAAVCARIDAMSADGDADLAALAATFQRGRTPLRHRAVIVAGTLPELRARLARFAAQGVGDADTFVGDAAGTDAADWRETDPLHACCARWVRGEVVDWASVQPPGRRLSELPTYPFERERYWAPRRPAGTTPAYAGRDAVAARVPARDDAPREDARAGLREAIDPAQQCGETTADAATEPLVWRAAALPSGLDWADRLRTLGRRQTCVVCMQDDDRETCERLLMQIAQAAALDVSSYLTCCTPADLRTRLDASPCEQVLLFGGVDLSDDVLDARLVGCLDALAACAGDAVPDLLLALRAAPADAVRRAERLAHRARPAGRRTVLMTHDAPDRATALQRLYVEWLTPAGAAAGGIERVRYVGAQRQLGRAHAEAPAAPMARLGKIWLPKPLPAASAAAPRRGTLLVLANHESLGIAQQWLPADGFAGVVLVADARAIAPGASGCPVNFGDAHAATEGAGALLARHRDVTHVIDLTDLYDQDRDHDTDKEGKLAFYQALVGAGSDLSIVYCTRGLQAFRAERLSLAGARFAGLVKMLGAEYRHVNARCVDLDRALHAAPGALLRVLRQELDAPLEETEICYRDGVRHAPRLDAQPLEPGTPGIAANGVYVVSGGANGVGLELANWLVDHGCTQLVLTGVTPLPPRARWRAAQSDATLSPYVRAKLAALVALEARVTTLRVHVGPLTDRHALQTLFGEVRAKQGEIRGVIHAAGVYSDAATPGFVDKDLAHIQRVWEPKIDALESLYETLRGDPLDFFVALSSATGVIPHLARGASDYATANAFADFCITYLREARGDRRCVALTWSDWNETGAITRTPADRAAAIDAKFAQLGLPTFPNAGGRALFAAALAAAPGSHLFVGYLDRPAFERVAPRLLYARFEPDALDVPGAPDVAVRPAEAGPLIDEIRRRLDGWEAERRAGRPIGIEEVAAVATIEQLRALDPGLITRVHALLFDADAAPAADLETLIDATVKDVLKLKQLDPATPFQNYGLDSISATVLATRLEKKLGREIKPQWLIDFSTARALSAHLAGLDRHVALN